MRVMFPVRPYFCSIQRIFGKQWQVKIWNLNCIYSKASKECSVREEQTESCWQSWWTNVQQSKLQHEDEILRVSMWQSLKATWLWMKQVIVEYFEVESTQPNTLLFVCRQCMWECFSDGCLGTYMLQYCLRIFENRPLFKMLKTGGRYSSDKVFLTSRKVCIHPSK